MLLQVFYFTLSIIGLFFGAELSLEASEKVGKSWKLSPLLIGMFIVGFGTSLPEFFVSQLACFRGVPSMAIGNIIGSNIANIFLILGISSLFYSLGVEGKEINKQFYFHFVLALLMSGVLYLGEVNLITTAVMSSFMALYFYLNLSSSDTKEFEDITVGKLEYLKILLGFTLLYASGELLVYSGSIIGKYWGISDFAISAIFVAFGTSFPELVTALVASYRKKDAEIIIGNVIGSNIFNGAFVLGSIGFYDFKLESSFQREIMSLIIISLIFLIFNKFKIRISKKISIFFLAVYGVFVYLWLI
jgi:cation:H+ antiporter